MREVDDRWKGDNGPELRSFLFYGQSVCSRAMSIPDPGLRSFWGKGWGASGVAYHG